MRRRIENPRILLLDCTLEYKKGESQTNIEVSKEDDWMNILKQVCIYDRISCRSAENFCWLPRIPEICFVNVVEK